MSRNISPCEKYTKDIAKKLNYDCDAFCNLKSIIFKTSMKLLFSIFIVMYFKTKNTHF